MPGGMSGKPSVVVRRVPDKGMYDNLYIVNCNIDYANISGLLRMPGSNAAITIGAVPPTSSSAGTGIWIDRTGLYGLASDARLLTIDATTGALSILSNTSYADTRAYRIIDTTSGTLFGVLHGWYNAGLGVHYVKVESKSVAAHDAYMNSYASAPTNYYAENSIYAASGATLAGMVLSADSDATPTMHLAVNCDIATGGGVYAGNSAANPTDGYVVFTGFTRCSAANYRRYYHITLKGADPGASGATWVVPSANTTGGWRLDAATELLYGQADVHADWDGASDLTFEVHFAVNVNNTGGGVGDTVDLKAVFYYKGEGETACKSQTVEVATVVGQSAQYKQFDASFTINWDQTSNVVEVGDIISVVLNLETDTSEVDDIVITAMEFYYNTTHVGIESGDA